MLRIGRPGLKKDANPQAESWLRIPAAGLVLHCLVAALATCASGAPSGLQTERHSSPQTALQFAIADFDGDSRPDLAAVESESQSSFHTQYWVAFQLSSGLRRTIGITAPAGGLQITSRDVNGDKFPDVVITTAWTNRPVAVLLNDGRGNFTEYSPQAFVSAFATCKIFLIATLPEIRDALGNVPMRYLDECEPVASGEAFHSLGRRLFREAAVMPNKAFLASFLGRAPPPLSGLLS